MNENIDFVDVEDTDDHIEILYSSLLDRKYIISHEKAPSYDEHIDFVKNHPYRAWVFVKKEKKIIGNFYIHQDNSIGIHFNVEHFNLLPAIFEMILKKWKPLPPIPSVRNKNFFVNAPSKNHELINTLMEIGANHIQSSFLLKEH
tara:strand:+ start:481 stop:915 length:435 start_codon:yes stop_codon:yes gene_type:complete